MSLCGVKYDTACPLLSIADVTVLFSLIYGANKSHNTYVSSPEYGIHVVLTWNYLFSLHGCATVTVGVCVS